MSWPTRTGPYSRSSRSVADLLRGLRDRPRPLLVLIDALDEASDPQQLVMRLLRPLIDWRGQYQVAARHPSAPAATAVAPAVLSGDLL
jgi:hypothetical protein